MCFGISAMAQETYTSSGRPEGAKRKEQKKKGFDTDRLIYGGGLGLGFGRSTTISVSPIIGYRITDKFSAGVGFGYQYAKIKNYFELQDINTGAWNYYDYKSSIASASVWTRYLILPSLFAHVEYEHNFMSFQNYRFAQNGTGTIESYKEKYNAPALLVGGGYRQAVTDRASITLMLLYDVIKDEYSPYQGIFPTIGFNIGF